MLEDLPGLCSIVVDDLLSEFGRLDVQIAEHDTILGIWLRKIPRKLNLVGIICYLKINNVELPCSQFCVGFLLQITKID